MDINEVKKKFEEQIVNLHKHIKKISNEPDILQEQRVLSRRKQISMDQNSSQKNDVSDLTKSREVFKLTEVDE